MRFDRRKTYPLRDKADESVARRVTDFRAFQALVPSRKGGVLYQRGPAALFNPINIAVGKLKHPYLYKIPAAKFTSGGFSPQAGSNVPQPGTGGGGLPDPTGPNVMIWEINTGLSGTFNLPLDQTAQPGAYNFDIYWGDGTSDHITEPDDVAKNHQYAAPGVYTITWEGIIKGVTFQFAPFSGLKMRDIKQWGTDVTYPNARAVYASAAMKVSAIDGPNLTESDTLEYFFQGCKGITTIDCTAWDTSTIQNWQNMFQSCSRLTELIANFDMSAFIPGDRNSGVRSFIYDTKIASIDVSGYNMNGMENFYQMFRNVDTLTEIIGMELWDTGPNSCNIEEMFEGSRSLTNLDISGIKVIDYAYKAFASCTSLQTVNVAGIDFSPCTIFDQMFNSCGALGPIVDFSTTTPPTAFITANSMFGNCNLLTSAPGIELWSTAGVGENFGGLNMFSNCPLTTVFWDAMITGWSATALATTVAGMNGGQGVYTRGGAVEVAADNLLALGWEIEDGGGPPNPLPVTLGNATSPDARIDFPVDGVWVAGATIVSNITTDGVLGAPVNVNVAYNVGPEDFAALYRNAINAAQNGITIGLVVDNGTYWSCTVNPVTGLASTISDFVYTPAIP